MKKLMLLLLTLTSFTMGQVWQLTTREPSYVKTFAVTENGDVWAGGAPNEFYRYSMSRGMWEEVDGVEDLQYGSLIKAGNGNLVAITSIDGNPVVRISANNGGVWNDVVTTETVWSSEWNVYGDTILGIEGTVSTDGGWSWGKCFNKDSLVGKYYPYGNEDLFKHQADSLSNIKKKTKLLSEIFHFTDKKPETHYNYHKVVIKSSGD